MAGSVSYYSMMEWIKSRREEFSLEELSGSLGDLGTFLPLLVGLAREIHLDVGATLIFTGKKEASSPSLTDMVY